MFDAIRELMRTDETRSLAAPHMLPSEIPNSRNVSEADTGEQSS